MTPTLAPSHWTADAKRPTLLTHHDLIQRARRWLLNSRSCSVVLTTGSIMCCEIPDVLGWRGGGWSVLVECKASRADFRRDQKKWHRHKEHKGLGNERYYFAEPGVIPHDEVPEGWGLLECRPKMVKVIRESSRDSKGHVSEIQILLAHINRTGIPADFWTCGDGDAI